MTYDDARTHVNINMLLEDDGSVAASCVSEASADLPHAGSLGARIIYQPFGDLASLAMIPMHCSVGLDSVDRSIHFELWKIRAP